MKHSTHIKEQSNHPQQDESKYQHIFLTVFQVRNGDVFLHHILVYPRHRNGNERPRQNLLHEETSIHHIRIKNTKVAPFAHHRETFGEADIHMMKNINHRCHQSQKHCRGLDSICPNDGFHAAFVSVKDNHQKSEQSRKPKRNAQTVQNHHLQYIYR